MIYEKLYPWQKDLVNQFKDRANLGLFLDMGLGKTPISLALAEQNNCTKIIIISINAKVLESETSEGSWLNWASKSNIIYNYSIKSISNFSVNQNDILLINYESLYKRTKNRTAKLVLRENVMDFIKTCKERNVAIIVDESHKMKDLHSMQTLAINKIKAELMLRASKLYTYLLTGTPFTTGYIDLYSQLKMLGYRDTKGAFVDEYCERGNVPGLLGWQQPIVGYKNVEQLFELVHKYAITIESTAVTNLPPQIFVKHPQKESIDFKMFISEKLPGRQIAEYMKLKGVLTPVLKAHFDTDTKMNNPYYRDIDYTPDSSTSRWLSETTGTFWIRARQLSIGFNGNAEECEWYDRRRLQELSDFLEQNPDNYLLFYNYTPEMLELYELCEKLGYNIDVYCGEVKSLTFYERYSSQTLEQRLTNTKNIILANFASGSTGLNWQLYNKCIVFSVPLYKDWAQGIKRIHRVGQTKTTIYHLFYQQNMLDISMRRALNECVQYNNDMFESDLSRVNSLNQIRDK